MARDSGMERHALDQWRAEHGGHAYATARDALSGALQGAESSVRRGEQNRAGAAVLDMVHDIMGMERVSSAPAPESINVRAEKLRAGLVGIIGTTEGGIAAQMLRASGKMFTRSDVLAVLRSQLALVPAGGEAFFARGLISIFEAME